MEQEALRPCPGSTGRQPVAERHTRGIREQRVLSQLFWKYALGQPWKEHDAKGTSPDLRGTRHQHPAIPARRGIGHDGPQPIGQHRANLTQANRPD